MNVEEIVKDMIEVAENSGPVTRATLLRGVAAIKHLQGKNLMNEADRLLVVANGK